MRSRRRRRCLRVAALRAVMSVFLVGTPPVAGEIRVYARKPLPTFPESSGLRTWGYLHDHCVIYLGVVCNVGGGADGVLRPEATAQSIAMWVHAAVRLDLGLGTTQNRGFARVDWEVGPRRPGTGSADTPLATEPTEPPGEPDDPCDPEAPGGVGPADKWRIDILLDRATLIEVKDYSKRAMVENQVDCYIARASERGLNIARDELLNAAPTVPGRHFKYAVPFVDNVGSLWCTWAPIAPIGHIYFARMEVALPAAAADCGGTALAVAAVTKKMIDKAKEAGVREEQFPGRVRPVVTPSYRRIRSNTQSTYVVSVPRHPTRSQELRVDFGDGASTLRTISPGPGVENVSLFKSFSVAGRYSQRIVVSDPGIVAEGEIPQLVFEATTDVDPAC